MFDVRSGLAYVPFAWQYVDAYHLMASFRQLRVRRGDSAEPLEPATLAGRMSAGLARAALGQRPRTVILHPFLMLDEAWFTGVRQLLSRLAALVREQRAWVVPGATFADWLRVRARVTA